MNKDELYYNSKIPLKINLLDINDIYTEWHKELKIIYVLKGNAFIDTGDLKISLAENHFILINSYDFVSVHPESGKNCLILELLIENSNLNRVYKDFSGIKFKCCSTDKNVSAKKYDTVREYIFRILRNITENRKEKEMLILREMLEITMFLLNNFKFEDVLPSKKISNKDRLIKILGFLEKNYDDDNLTVDDVAEYVDLSSHYVLKVFRENFDTGLMNYLNAMRVKKSVNDLLHTNKSIIEVAIDNGFTNTKSYHRIFKKIFDTSPGVYRKQNKENEIKIKQEDFLSKKKLLQEIVNTYFSSKADIENLSKFETNIIDIDFKKIKKIKLNHYWGKVISLGKATEGLKGDIQFQIKELKRDINPEYIKFNGIFNDEMNVYNEDARGNVIYNFSYIDKLLDFLIQNNLKPFINVGFMPKKLAKEDKYIPVSNTNTSYPKDLKLWTGLLSNFIRHILDRYGEEEVCTWYFEIWNNPDLQNVYWHETKEKFFRFFKESFNCIKKISPLLKAGGPSSIINDSWDWTMSFCEFIKKNNLNLDFFTFHNYSTKGQVVGKDNLFDPKLIEIDLSDREELLKKLQLKIIQEFGRKPEIIISEWNLSPFTHFSYDTCYASSFIVNKVLKNLNRFSKMVYWTSTENRIGTNIFYGGLGLFTTNNLKKASYNAFVLLNKLGNEYISRGENHVVTLNKNSIQIMFYYHDKDRIEDKEEFYNRVDSKKIQINLKNLESSNYLITKYYLDKENGSIHDAWLDMGAPKKITNEIFDYLKSKEKIRIKTEEKNIENTMIIEETLDSNSIVFIEIKKENIY